FRTPAQFAAAQRDIQVLERCGVPYELLDRARLQTAEPALARSAHKLAGGLRLPNDETGDCRLFTRRLAQMAADLGVEVRHGQQVQGLRAAGPQGKGDQLDVEPRSAVRSVAPFGGYTRVYLVALWLVLPVDPVKVYSFTVPLAQADAAPLSTLLDEAYKVAITRFDNRIR